MTAHGATWTSERIERLKNGFDAGLSCSQIAREIGVTRNAVIGKMNRMGLTRPRDLIGRLPKREAPAGPLRAKRTKAWRPWIWDRGGAEDTLTLSAFSAPEPSEGGGTGCSLLELGQGHCRWPISDPGAENFCFCGREPLRGLPYCLGHARKAYRSGRSARP